MARLPASLLLLLPGEPSVFQEATCSGADLIPLLGSYSLASDWFRAGMWSGSGQQQEGSFAAEVLQTSTQTRPSFLWILPRQEGS